MERKPGTSMEHLEKTVSVGKIPDSWTGLDLLFRHSERWLKKYILFMLRTLLLKYKDIESHHSSETTKNCHLLQCHCQKCCDHLLCFPALGEYDSGKLDKEGTSENTPLWAGLGCSTLAHSMTWEDLQGHSGIFLGWTCDCCSFKRLMTSFEGMPSDNRISSTYMEIGIGKLTSFVIAN